MSRCQDALYFGGRDHNAAKFGDGFDFLGIDLAIGPGAFTVKQCCKFSRGVGDAIGHDLCVMGAEKLQCFT